MNATDFATTVAAWGGLALGVAGIVHSSIVDYVAHRKKLRVFFQRRPVVGTDGKGRLEVFIAVVNVCERPITVTNVWAGFGKKGDIGSIYPTFCSPDFKSFGVQLLEPGAFVAGVLPEAAQADKPLPADLQCFALDAENKVYYGKKIRNMYDRRAQA